MEDKDIIEKQIIDYEIQIDLMIRGLENKTTVKRNNFEYFYKSLDLIRRTKKQLEYLNEQLKKIENEEEEKKEYAREILGLKGKVKNE